MKTQTIFKTATTLFLMIGLSMNILASTDLNSPPAPNMEKSTNSSTTFDVPATMNTDVAVFNDEGLMIFSDNVVKNETAGKSYDLSRIEDGTYTLITDTDIKRVEKTIEIKNNIISIVKQESYYRPVFDINGDILSVSYLNDNKNDIHIELESDSELYFEEYGGNDMAYGKMLNIEKLPRGKYSVNVTAGNKTFYYPFNK